MQTVCSADGTSIAFDRSGQGPALIPVGGATSTRRDLAPFAAPLAPDFTVFAYDRRGKGDSGDTQPYAVEREVEDIDALIKEAGGSAFLFGHSSGAVLALEAARLLPGKIKKLAVYEPPFIVDDSRPPQPKDYLAQLKELVAEGRRGDAVEMFQRHVGISPEMIAQFRQTPMWAGLEAMAPTLVYEIIILGDTESGSPEPLRKWAGVEVPTLVMDGTVTLGSVEGHTWMRHGADELARVLPHAQRCIMEGQDHGPAPELLAGALKQFFIG
jgi:pimeloyl-ACP methyl ester carboxylesterase